MFLGLRSLIYPAPDLDAQRAWYTKVLGYGPYYDEHPYVGFEVGGHELGLFAFGDPAAGPKTYWGVENADAALAFLIDAGGTLDERVEDVGGGIRMGAVKDPAGFVFGFIENPNSPGSPTS